jgi:hypothetical protein
VYASNGVVVVEGSFLVCHLLVAPLFCHDTSQDTLRSSPRTLVAIHTASHEQAGAKEVVISNAATGQNFTVTEHMELVEQFSEARATLEATRAELADAKAVLGVAVDRIYAIEGLPQQKWCSHFYSCRSSHHGHACCRQLADW